MRGINVGIGPIPLRGGVRQDETTGDPFDAKNWVSTILIAIAGPISNLIQAVVAILLGLLVGGPRQIMATRHDLLGVKLGQSGFAYLARIFEVGWNHGVPGSLLAFGIFALSIAILNLIPLPPLDGGRVVLALAARIFNGRWKQVLQTAYIVLSIGTVALLIWTEIPEITDFFHFMWHHIQHIRHLIH